MGSGSRIGVSIGGDGLIGGAVCGEADAEEGFDLFFFLMVLSITSLSTEESAITGELILLDVMSSQLISVFVFVSYLNG